jgi:hypothetical protein
MSIAPTPRSSELSPEESRQALDAVRRGLPVFCVDSGRPVRKTEHPGGPEPSGRLNSC